MFTTRSFLNVMLVKCSGQFTHTSDVYFCSKETISNLGPVISIAMKNMAMGVWGWWAFDIFTLMASYLGPSVTAA